MGNESGFTEGMIRPLNQQVVIIQDIGDAISEGGIHITEAARSKFRSGKIVAKADDCERPIESGDRVGWQKFAGTPMDIIDSSGAELSVIVMHEQSLTMVISDDVRLGGRDS